MAPPDLVTVYRITCLVNGKAYIGITTKSLRRRWSQHVTLSVRAQPKTLLASAIRKHGPARFAVEVLYEAVDKLEACVVERGLIAAHNTLCPNGYNLTTGGETSVGRRLSIGVKQRLSQATIAAWADPENRARFIAGFKNRRIEPSHIEHLRALAEGQKGQPRGEEFREKQRIAQLGHAVSAETRAKIGARSKGRAWSQENKDRQSARAKAMHASGRLPAVKWSDERKAAHSAKIKARHAAGLYPRDHANSKSGEV